MKKYQNEEDFVKGFAKDAKEGIKSNGNFEAVVNGINVIVTGMDNNNSSKVTVYSGTVDGVEFTGSITALKKKLNVTFTKDYNRSADGTTKVAIKSDEELQKTAETAAERYIKAAVLIADYDKRYNIPEGATDIQAVIFEALKAKRDNEVERRANEAKRKAEEAAAKIEAEKAKLEKQLAELQAKLAKM